MNVDWIIDCLAVSGFTTLSLLSYGGLEESAQGYFDGMERKKNQRFQINSKVVTVSVSNRNTSYLEEPVNMTFYHLNKVKFAVLGCDIVIQLCKTNITTAAFISI